MSILMVLKAPGPRYFMPVIGAIALGNAAIMSQSLARRGMVRIGGVFLVVLLVLGVWRNALATAAWAQNAAQVQTDNQKLLAKTSASGCRQVFYYDVNTPTYNLSFGDEYTPKHFSSNLKKLYPNSIFYDVFGHRFQTFTGPMSSKEANSVLATDRCVYLVGSPVERYPDFGISRRDLSLVTRTDHGLGDSIAVYAWRAK
jgi:hypothetical protein